MQGQRLAVDRREAADALELTTETYSTLLIPLRKLW
jgi:hypothetical protein